MKQIYVMYQRVENLVQAGTILAKSLRDALLRLVSLHRILARFTFLSNPQESLLDTTRIWYTKKRMRAQFRQHSIKRQKVRLINV